MQRLPDLPGHAGLLPGHRLLRPQRRVDGLQHAEHEDHHPDLGVRRVQIQPGTGEAASDVIEQSMRSTNH